MSRKKSEPLTPRKLKYIKGRVDGKSKRQAAIDAGFPVSMAENVAAKIETPDVRQAFAALVRQKIPAERIVERICEGMDAQETVFAKFEGRITDSKQVVSFSERRAYTEMAAKFGNFIPKDQPDTIIPIQVVIDL
jgi:hypothetical protein